MVAIKQTVYRTGADSELMQILIDAARAGKEVTVVVELMARFDEEANINWAAQLEEVGAHVVYGVVGHKTHAKMALVVRREPRPEGTVLRRYAHLGTGNYHSRTARLYTDFGLLTAQRGHLRRRERGVQAAHRARPRGQAEARLAVAVHAAQARASRRSSNEARIAGEGQPGAHHRQDERAARARRSSRSSTPPRRPA